MMFEPVLNNKNALLLIKKKQTKKLHLIITWSKASYLNKCTLI